MNRENYKYQIEKMAQTSATGNQRILNKYIDLFDQPTKLIKSKKGLSRKAKIGLGAGALSASALGIGAYEFNKIHMNNKDKK